MIHLKSNAPPALELHNLTVMYDSKPVLWNVDYEVPSKKLVGIVGPNGSGKTTMLKSIMGLLSPSSGYVKIFDQDLAQVRDRVAYVPQRGSVDWDFPINVFDTVLMGRFKRNRLFQRSSREDKEIAMECLKKVQMEKFVKRQISQLSGGQQQRVFIARALAQQADLYLMDEPFAGVDAATESAILDILQDMQAAGKTIIVVHHDLQTVAQYFNWLVMLNTRLIASGPVEQVFVPDILEQTYGGNMSILSQVMELVHKQAHPVRERRNR